MDIFSFLMVLKIIMWLVFPIGLIVLFFVFYSIYTNLTTGVPWAKIPEENIDKIFQEINLPKDSLLYELGCGDGRVLLATERLGFRVIGYELSLYPYLKAWFKILINQSQAKIKRQDFLKENFDQADAIFIFLNDKMILRLSPKLKQELKPGTIVISYGFVLPDWLLHKTILTKPSLTYIYRV